MHTSYKEENVQEPVDYNITYSYKKAIAYSKRDKRDKWKIIRILATISCSNCNAL